MRDLSLFVMVLSYSRKIYGHFYFDQSMASFLSAHLRAFKEFGGMPESLLYDNLKSAVVSRVGGCIQFNANLLRFAAECHFKVDACNPRSGWEKGKVERAIRYIRDNFMTARKIENIHTLNSELAIWLSEQANRRVWPQDKQRRVEEVWHEDERCRLRSPAQNPEAIEVKLGVRVGKTPYVCFDTNHYSVPAKYVQKDVILWVSEERVRVFCDTEEIAKHQRSYACGKDIEDMAHICEMLRERKAAREQVRRRLVYQNIANAEAFLKQLAAGGANLSLAYKKIYDLASRHPLSVIDEKMGELLSKELVSVAGLIQLLENETLPCFELDLSAYPSLDSQMVYRKDLNAYQNLGGIPLQAEVQDEA
jgi:hypothetical protein